MKTLEDYHRLLKSGYQLSVAECRHMNSLWEEILKRKNEIIKNIRSSV